MPYYLTLNRIEDWHQAYVILPRRAIDGTLVRGAVWKKFDGRRWIYKRYFPQTIRHIPR